MTFKTSRIAAIAAIAGAACGGASIANAVTKRAGNQTTTPAATANGNPNEKALTGDTLKSASDAAIAANAGAKVIAATTEDPAENTGAAYEVHITKADGARATVLEDSAFKVLSTQTEQRHDGPGHHGGPGRNPNEKALTGDVAAKVRAAALAKVSGTVERVETNVDSSAPYEAHIRKADGSQVVVEVNQDYTVAAVKAMGAHP